MKLTPTVAKSLMPTILFTISNFGAAAAMTTKDRMRGRAAAGDPLPVPVEEIVELCPNPDFQPIDENIPCLNYTDPATPKGYGQRDTCSKFGYLVKPRLGGFRVPTWGNWHHHQSMCMC